MLMLGKTYDNEVCSAARALELVGERWTLLIVRNALFAGCTRYGDFQKRLGIATNILKTRLDGLVAAEIMTFKDGEYLLTERGHDLVPVILALTAWGDRWVADKPPILYKHSTCGGAISQQVACAECGVVDEPSEVIARVGPGMPAGRTTRLS